jgi:hypothetical protein
MAAVRVSLSWFGVRKTLTAEQRSQAADTFGAEGGFLSAGKKLLDTAHPAFKAVTSVKGRIISLWKSMSLPFPEPGMRLIRQDQIETFNTQLQSLKDQVDGQRKVFRNSAVDNLTDFFQRFRALNVRSNDQLDELVAQCQQIVRGVEPQALRDNQGLRQHVSQQLAQVENVLDSLLVDRPRRNILRRPK